MDLTKILSEFFGAIADRKISKKLIPLVEWYYSIDKSRFADSDFLNLNDWFKRDLNEIILEDGVLSPCESFMKVYSNIDSKQLMQVKGKTYDIDGLVNEDLNGQYDGGTCLIFRLTPGHYHNYHHMFDGVINSKKNISGKYYPVNNLGLNLIDNLFLKNKRDVVSADTKIGEVKYVDVGALNVGSIVQLDDVNDKVKRGSKRGYFQFGGSTVVVFIEKDKIIIDSKYNEGSEHYVMVGQKIGKYQNELS